MSSMMTPRFLADGDGWMAALPMVMGEVCEGWDIFRMKEKEFSFAIIKLEAIKRHSATYVGNTCLKFMQGLLLGVGTSGVVVAEV